MNVQVIQDQSLVLINSLSAEKLVVDFLAFYNQRFDEAAVHFVSTPAICALHDQFFGDPSVTDCISFPMDDAEEDGYRVLGDLFVCPETAVSYVATNGGSIYREVTLYLTHGLLHLIGYDDLKEADRLQMRIEEARYLENVEAKGLWIHP